MFKNFMSAFSFSLLLSTPAAMAVTEYNPTQFTNYFREITNGDHRYRGIELTAPADFQKRFLTRYDVASWVGDQSRVESSLTKSSVNLWGDWYKTTAPARLAFPSDSARTAFTSAFEKARSKNCSRCRAFDDLFLLDWASWTTEERSLFATTYVFSSPMFSGRKLIEFVADHYDVTVEKVTANLDVKMLNHDDFSVEVRKMGWKGEIYFRGITGPEPLNADRVEILLDGDYLRDRTEETVPLFQMFEFVGILTHELNHVFQTFESRQMGYDLQIQSMEGALLIEGGAESLAEKAMKSAAVAAEIPALNLYASEQAIGIMSKDAEKTYQFLPYKVGLPFVDSLYGGTAKPATIRTEMYKTITGTSSLSDLVQRLSTQDHE